MSERRQHSRTEVFFPVRIDTAQKSDRVGVTRNASDRGLLIATPSRFAPGDELKLTYSLHLGEPQHTVWARVVRVGFDAEADLFCRLVAVEIEAKHAA